MAELETKADEATQESYIVQPLKSEIEDTSSNVVELKIAGTNLNKSANELHQAFANIDARVRGEVYDEIASRQSTAYYRADLLRRASMRHSWTRATVMTVARSAVGAGFSIVRHPIYGSIEQSSYDDPRQLPELRDLYDFFYGQDEPEVLYIQDLFPNASKIMYTVASLVLYGQAAWEIKYDSDGRPIGFDVLPGIVFPNVNKKGKFKRPAYYFRPWNSDQMIPLRDPKKVFYLTWPGTDYSIYGTSEYIAASETSIPSDLYAATVYKAHFENVNAPFNGFWVVSKETSDEDFRKFMKLVFNRYTGVRNFGRNPIAIRGDAEFKEMRSRSNDDAPYLEGRKYNQEELSAVSGVSSSKLGLGSNVNRTNFREQRRDFWETTLRPIYALIEESIYRQVFVRLFNAKEWMLVFNRPDLTTALEQATIETRYVQNGIKSPNEARIAINLPPRQDEMGNHYYDPVTAKTQSGIGENQTSQTPQAAGDRAREGESDRSRDNQRVPTSDRPQNDEPSPNKVIDELRTWRRFALNVSKDKRPYRPFVCEVLDKDTESLINSFTETNQDNKELIATFFDQMIESVSNIT